MTDSTSGFRAANRRVIEFFARNYPDDYPEVEALVLLHRVGMRMAEVSITMRERTGGRSSITPIRSIYYMTKVLMAIFIDLMKKLKDITEKIIACAIEVHSHGSWFYWKVFTKRH